MSDSLPLYHRACIARVLVHDYGGYVSIHRRSQVVSAETKGRRELQEARSLAAAMEDRASSLQDQASDPCVGERAHVLRYICCPVVLLCRRLLSFSRLCALLLSGSVGAKD